LKIDFWCFFHPSIWFRGKNLRLKQWERDFWLFESSRPVIHASHSLKFDPNSNLLFSGSLLNCWKWSFLGLLSFSLFLAIKQIQTFLVHRERSVGKMLLGKSYHMVNSFKWKWGSRTDCKKRLHVSCSFQRSIKGKKISLLRLPLSKNQTPLEGGLGIFKSQIWLQEWFHDKNGKVTFQSVQIKDPHLKREFGFLKMTEMQNLNECKLGKNSYSSGLPFFKEKYHFIKISIGKNILLS